MWKAPTNVDADGNDGNGGSAGSAGGASGDGHQRGSSIADFDIIKVISKGGYGRVFLASLKEDEEYDDEDTEGKKPQKKKKDYFAIKVMRRLSLLYYIWSRSCYVSIYLILVVTPQSILQV